MSQRSPYNDRYKVDQKGKTRRSASAAKPKRAVADLGSGTKPKPAKSTAWSRAKAASKSSSRSTPAALPTSPRMKELRRAWWVAWGVALGVAVLILGVQAYFPNLESFLPIGWGIWLASMGVAFYLEFFPIRKERAALVAAAREGKSHKAAKVAPQPSKPKKVAASDNAKAGLTTPQAPDADAPEPPSDEDDA